MTPNGARALCRKICWSKVAWRTLPEACDALAVRSADLNATIRNGAPGARKSARLLASRLLTLSWQQQPIRHVL